MAVGCDRGQGDRDTGDRPHVASRGASVMGSEHGAQ